MTNPYTPFNQLEGSGRRQPPYSQQTSTNGAPTSHFVSQGSVGPPLYDQVAQQGQYNPSIAQIGPLLQYAPSYPPISNFTPYTVSIPADPSNVSLHHFSAFNAAAASGQQSGYDPKYMVPMKHNSTFNLNTMLAKNILNSTYFRTLFEITEFSQILDEIQAKVDNVEPFLTHTGAASNTASTAFCLLYKLFTMKLTKKQIYTMMDDKSSPQIRCLALLYLRYTCPPDQIWRFFKNCINDDQSFSPIKNSRPITFGNYARKLLTEQKYYGTLLPRIPKKIETDIQVEFLKIDRKLSGKHNEDPRESSKSSALNSNSNQIRNEARKTTTRVEGEFKLGDLVKARYSGDGKWYESEIIERSKSDEKDPKWVVKYLDYDEEEEVSVKYLKLVKTKDDILLEKQQDEDQLRQRVLERNRDLVTTSNKSDYSKKIITFKRNISVPLNSKSVSQQLNQEDVKSSAGFKSVDEALQKYGRIGEVESIDVEERERRERKRKERQRELENRYGNAASQKSRSSKRRR